MDQSAELPARRARHPRLDGSAYADPRVAVHLVARLRAAYCASPTGDRVATLLLSALRETADERGVGLWCYCLMPDHLHVLARPRVQGASLLSFMKVFKAKASVACRTAVPAGMWQRSFYDRVVRPSDDFRGLCLYILENPVRRGLVSRWQEYGWSWIAPELVEGEGEGSGRN